MFTISLQGCCNQIFTGNVFVERKRCWHEYTADSRQPLHIPAKLEQFLTIEIPCLLSKQTVNNMCANVHSTLDFISSVDPTIWIINMEKLFSNIFDLLLNETIVLCLGCQLMYDRGSLRLDYHRTNPRNTHETTNNLHDFHLTQ